MNWKQQRSGRAKRRKTLETIQEKNEEKEKENEQKFEGDKIKEWNEKNKIGNLRNPYNEL